MKAIGGVMVAAITPHGKQGHQTDFGATLELIDFLCRCGVQGIALLGSTGEFVHLSLDERVRLVYLATKRSRLPVLAGISHSSLDGALELGREACSAGAAGLLLMPPHFFRYGQDEIKEFYVRFAAQIGAGVPVYLYNIPFFTSEIGCETALGLLESGAFAGIKDSSGRFEYFLRLKELCDRRPFTLLVGNDIIFTRARSAGAHGIVSGVACAVPELLVALDQAIRSGTTAEVELLDSKLQEFLRWLDLLPTPVGIRVALGARGMKIGTAAVPLSRNTQKIADEFRDWFQGWLPAVRKNSAHA